MKVAGGLIPRGHRWEDIRLYTVRQLFWFSWMASEQEKEEFKSRMHAVRIGTKASNMDEPALKQLLLELDDAPNS